MKLLGLFNIVTMTTLSGPWLPEPGNSGHCHIWLTACSCEGFVKGHSQNCLYATVQLEFANGDITETIWLGMPEICATWLFTEEGCWCPVDCIILPSQNQATML